MKTATPELVEYIIACELEDTDGWHQMKGEHLHWTLNTAAEVTGILTNNELSLNLTAQKPVKRVRFFIHKESHSYCRLLGDAWERGYGELEWSGIRPEKIIPWYFIIEYNDDICGLGVKTGAAAFCSWRITADNIIFTADIRNGGSAVELNNRQLHICSIIYAAEKKPTNIFAAAHEFCRMLCPSPLLPSAPVYGSNNWYYAYGNSSHNEIIKDTELLAQLTDTVENRPFMVIDDGWQFSRNGSATGGPWRYSNWKFPDMGKLAEEIQKNSVQPGIWIRPLCTVEAFPSECLLDNSRFYTQEKIFHDHEYYLDPSHPFVLEYLAKEISYIKNWGYKLIKHDFSTYDILGRWGSQMGEQLTNNNWHFWDRSKTTAEIISGLYQTIRAAAGSNILLIGCNTVSHLAAGYHEIQRTGDDTSGIYWETTSRVGINTLAFRMPQHNAFYAADADCVGITDKIPWEYNKQWLDLLARSGTPFFVSADPKILTADMRRILKEAYHTASKARTPAIPIDWQWNSRPADWLIDGETVHYTWV